MANWVSQSKYCALKGDTPGAVDKRIKRGIWINGIHAKKPQGSRER